MNTILFSLATTDTAGPSAEVRVPTRKSTLSLRMSSRACRTASLASALESRTTSSILRPSTPPLALSSSMNIWAPLEAGSPNSAAGAAAVHIAGRVELHAVGRAGLVAPGLRPQAAVAQPPVTRDIEHANVLAGGVVDEQPPLVEREAEAVGPVEVVHEQPRRLGI